MYSLIIYSRLYYRRDPSRAAMCPSTIHSLLHIADYIEAAGPVWCTWAFPMERFCGSLQLAIKSRRFPYASMDNYLVDSAHLMIIKLRKNLGRELSLRSDPIERGVCIPGCAYSILPCCCRYAHIVYIDPTCAFYPPSNKTPTVEAGIMSKVLAALSTRYSLSPSRPIPVSIVRACLTEPIHEYGTMKITIGGADTLHASKMGSRGPDRRDATFVRVRMWWLPTSNCAAHFIMSLVRTSSRHPRVSSSSHAGVRAGHILRTTTTHLLYPHQCITPARPCSA
jgi:hypothetical protein